MATTGDTTKGAARRRSSMSDTAKMTSLALLGVVALALLSLILLFCGVAAVSAIDGLAGARSNLVAFTWAILLMYAILLALATCVLLAGWKRPAFARRLYFPLIILLAILIAWMGVEADKATRAERAFSGTADTRAGVWAAGLIMCAVTASLLLLGLLALDAMMGHRHGDAVRSPVDSGHHGGEAVPVGGAAVHRVASPAPATLSVGSHSAVTASPHAAGGVIDPSAIPQPPAGGAQPMVLTGGTPHAAGTQPQAEGVPGTVVHHNQTFGQGASPDREQQVIA